MENKQGWQGADHRGDCAGTAEIGGADCVCFCRVCEAPVDAKTDTCPGCQVVFDEVCQSCRMAGYHNFDVCE